MKQEAEDGAMMMLVMRKEYSLTIGDPNGKNKTDQLRQAQILGMRKATGKAAIRLVSHGQDHIPTVRDGIMTDRGNSVGKVLGASDSVRCPGLLDVVRLAEGYDVVVLLTWSNSVRRTWVS